MRLAIECPAKINSFLSVGPPFPSGYHPIRSYFHTISLYDRLEVEPFESDALECEGMELPSENTLSKTLRFAREMFPVPPLRIKLTKRIPTQSGLGGGSSDAAGLIRIIEKLTGREEHPFWKDVAVSVGADVPFFLKGGSARVSGIGEILEPIATPSWILLLCQPQVVVSTKDAYQKLDERPREWLGFPVDAQKLHNDFEFIAPPEVTELKKRLVQLGANCALMSGSGSAVFGVFGSAEIALCASQSLHDCPFVGLARTLPVERLPKIEVLP